MVEEEPGQQAEEAANEEKAKEEQKWFLRHRLAHYLQIREMNPHQLALAMDTYPSNVAHWLIDANEPKVSFVIKMARALHTSVLSLIQGAFENREEVALALEDRVGDPEAEIVRAMESLSPDDRAELVKYVRGWIAARVPPKPDT